MKPDNTSLIVRLKERASKLIQDKPLPASITAGLKNINLAQDMQKDDQTRTALEKLESIQVKDSKVILKARKPKE